MLKVNSLALIINHISFIRPKLTKVKASFVKLSFSHTSEGLKIRNWLVEACHIKKVICIVYKFKKIKKNMNLNHLIDINHI